MEERYFSRYRWVIEGIVLPLHIGIGMNFIAPAPLFPIIMEHYDINRGTVSLLLGAVTVVLTVFLIPGGILAARIGPRKAIADSNSPQPGQESSPHVTSFMGLQGQWLRSRAERSLSWLSQHTNLPRRGPQEGAEAQSLGCKKPASENCAPSAASTNPNPTACGHGGHPGRLWGRRADLYPTFPRSAAWVRRNPVRVLPI